MRKKRTPDEIFSDKIAHILRAEKQLDKTIAGIQRQFFEMVSTEYLPLFKLKDGIVLDIPFNDRLVLKMDNYFNKLEKLLYRDALGSFATALLKSVQMSGEYYVGLGFKKSIVDPLIKDVVHLETRIGITATGRVRKGSYLYRLGKTAAVRDDLKNYVVRNLTGDTSFLDFQLGFRNLVVGNKRVKGLSTKGSLQKYFDQYAYDAFNEFDAVANSQLARNLNLQHFIYEGSIIDTTRPFCRKKAGKAFKVSEVLKGPKAWKDDADLIDKKTKDAYRPLIERGRKRCRHFIKYITETVYKALKGI